mmetsp:Transcript_27981/g.34529  ORF Transcript_27981/g.34529 Transcript_27981/m.34529 type:complete len:154 (+) Transcript_27981:231-692(+)
MSTEESAQSTVEHGKPTEFMSCLVTMEDITDENYVEYQCYPSMKWKPAQFEQSVVEQLLESQFQAYIDRVKKTDCQAELRRLLEKGPPVYIYDQHGLALDDDEEYVVTLWFANDGQERSAKLKNAVDGEERQKLWDSLNKFLIVEGKEEIDDD